MWWVCGGDETMTVTRQGGSFELMVAHHLPKEEKKTEVNTAILNLWIQQYLKHSDISINII